MLFSLEQRQESRDSIMNKPNTTFAAIVLAADRAPGDPVAEAAGVCCKSLAPVGGRPMVVHVLDALAGARAIDAIVLCGPHQSAIDQEAALRSKIASGETRWIESQATPSSSAHRALQSISEDTKVLVTTADHALLSSRMVDHFCCEARTSGCDIVAGLASHDLVAAAFPETRRTIIKLRDGAYCGCNLFAFLTPRARVAARLWQTVEEKRKKVARLISALGWLAVVRYALGLLSLEEVLERISGRMGLRAGVVIMPFPEAAVDVDSVSDWKLVRKIMADRPR